MKQSKETPVYWSLGWLCALASVLAILATLPFVGMGVNDDFSYAQIALKAAETGKLIYNGWNTPMIGFQAYWAALFIRVFGFSFDIVRMSTLPFVAGCALLLYYLARRCGASVLMACVATFFVTISPIAIPLEASFMTDIPALFFLLLCFVAALRAIDLAGQSGAWFWLCALAITGVVGGTVRQVVWLAPVFLFPLLALRTKSVAGRMVILLLWIATCLSAYKLSAWFSSQPYSVALSLIPTPRARVRGIATNIWGMYLECSILFIPLFSLYAKHFKQMTSRSKVLIVATSLGIPLAMVALSLVHPSSNLVAFDYFDGNVITKNGILASNVEAIGQKPIIIPFLLQAVLIAVAFAVQFTAASAVLQTVRQKLNLRNLLNADGPIVLSQLLVMFTIPYLGTVFSRSLTGLAIDRYLLPILAIGVLLLLSIDLVTVKPSWKLAMSMLILFAFYGIATTHDYFACSRARLTAANDLIARKVKAAEISAGLEFDGWTQISLNGYINDARITIPKNAYLPQEGRSYPLSPPYWFWSFTPSLEPKYFVVLSPQSQLAASDISPVLYDDWLPPFERKVLVQVAKSHLK